MGDALKRRCLHLYIPLPDAKLEEQIVTARVPDIEERLRRAKMQSSLVCRTEVDLSECGASLICVGTPVGDDGQLHYGSLRVALLGVDQDNRDVMVFDWAYQPQAGNPALAPAR